MGGAIYLNCLNEIANLNRDCDISLVGNNSFINNVAATDGGAILWVSNRFTDDKSNFFEGNKAVYGDNIGSYPGEININFLSNNDYHNPVNRSLSTKNRYLQTAFPNIVSGTPFDLLINILDNDGNIFKSDNTSIAALKLVNKSPVDVILNNEAIANKGVYNFSKV